MENNEIMQRLLQEDSHSEKKSENYVVNQQYNSDGIPMSKIRVVTAKYKVLIVILLIIIGILWLIRIPELKSIYNSKKDTLNDLKSQLSSINIQIKEARDNDNFRKEIEENEKSIIDCINNKKTCVQLPDNLKEKVWSWERDYTYAKIPVSYLQVHSLYTPKMAVDEKRILRNLNEYLIKQEFWWNPKERVWEIMRISIWDPTVIYNSNEHFFEVPLDITIEFKDINWLTGILANIEKKIIDTAEDRILYKVQTVSYDIIENDEPQTTDIQMLAYYYYDEKFEKKADEENNEWNTEVDNKENNDSTWISNMLKNS